MKLFLTGGTGYVGSAILEAFLKEGDQVTVLIRNKGKEKILREKGAKVYVGDLKHPESFCEAAVQHDLFIHAGYEMSPEGSQVEKKLVETLLISAKDAAHPFSFIYTSGVWVLGNTGDHPLDESAPANHPAEIVAWRVQVEQMVLSKNEGSLAAAVIRPGIVYGGNKGICSGFFASALKEGKAVYVGDGKNRWSLVHRSDLARLYYLVAKKRASGIFHGVDGTPTSVLEMAKNASAASGRNGEVQALSLEKARETMGAFADALALDQVVSAKRSSELGWNPVFKSFTANIQQLYKEFTSVEEKAAVS